MTYSDNCIYLIHHYQNFLENFYLLLADILIEFGDEEQVVVKKYRGAGAISFVESNKIFRPTLQNFSQTTNPG